MLVGRITGIATATALSALVISAALAPAPAAASAQRWQIVKVLPAVEQEYVVSASGPKNAWATGAESLSNGQKLDVEHWNGRVWQRIAPPPHLGVLDFAAPFAAVGSSSATNAWVFPYQGTVRPNYALHWHEGHWTTMRLSRGAAISATAVRG